MWPKSIFFGQIYFFIFFLVRMFTWVDDKCNSLLIKTHTHTHTHTHLWQFIKNVEYLTYFHFWKSWGSVFKKEN